MNYFRQLKVREKVHLLADFFDYIIIGSGFGASVSALRLTEKGYSVLIIEKGKRYRDQDFAGLTCPSGNIFGSRQSVLSASCK